MSHDQTTRYRVELHLLERATHGEERAIVLLRSEFALAINAGHFMALSGRDIVVDVRSRYAQQQGVARFGVVVDLEERTPAMSDGQAVELLHREFQRALNASHFIGSCRDDLRVVLLARGLAETALASPAAR